MPQEIYIIYYIYILYNIPWSLRGSRDTKIIKSKMKQNIFRQHRPTWLSTSMSPWPHSTWNQWNLWFRSIGFETFNFAVIFTSKSKSGFWYLAKFSWKTTVYFHFNQWFLVKFWLSPKSQWLFFWSVYYIHVVQSMEIHKYQVYCCKTIFSGS